MAVVLGNSVFGTSQVLAALHRGHGRVRAIKGHWGTVRFAVGVDLLDVGVVVFSSRRRTGGAATLTDEAVAEFVRTARELFRIHAGQYMTEVTAQLTEDWDARCSTPGIHADGSYGRLQRSNW
jgi:hypothetical protein